MSENYVDESPEYWAGYSNLQHVKHELIRRYLGPCNERSFKQLCTLFATSPRSSQWRGARPTFSSTGGACVAVLSASRESQLLAL